MTSWDLVVPRPTSLAWPVPIDPTGTAGPTRGSSRGPRWRRVAHGLYVPATADGDLPEQRTIEAAALQPRAVVTGWASLRWWGARYHDGIDRDGSKQRPVAVAVGGARPDPRDGVLVLRDQVPDDEVVLVRGLWVTTPERALFDEIRIRGELREAVVAADMAYAAGLTSIRRMLSYVADRRWYRHRRTALDAIQLSDEHSRSPQETRFRLIWVLDCGWRDPLCNRRVFAADGRFVATPDLLDLDRGVVGEYAGAEHRDIGRHELDVARQADLRSVRLEHVEVVGRDLRRPQLVVRRMEEAAARVQPGPRLWRPASAPSPTIDEVLEVRRPRRAPTHASKGGSRTRPPS